MTVNRAFRHTQLLCQRFSCRVAVEHGADQPMFPSFPTRVGLTLIRNELLNPLREDSWFIGTATRYPPQAILTTTM